MPDIETSTVIAAVYALKRRRGNEWPTRREIAEYLKCPDSTVKLLLVQLRKKRIMRDRARKGETRWMPWDEI